MQSVMHRRQMLGVFASFALCPMCAATSFGEDIHEGHHWSYEGATGPDRWGSVDPANGACATGTQQSPINIEGTISAQQQPLKISWTKQANTIVNNGHTIQLDFAEGGTLVAGTQSFTLTQFHFHHPSEHLINGRSSAMEVHFVHAAPGRLAVVGVLITPGRNNAVFNKIVSTMPPAEASPVRAHPAIDPSGLLPAKRAYYRYEGSLTTPPCSETVDWFVLAEQIEVADADIARFAKLYPANARPAQNLNRRFILGFNQF